MSKRKSDPTSRPAKKITSPLFDASPPATHLYRAGVGIVLVNRLGLIFSGKRRDNRLPPWQMPQGGLMPGETPRQAAFRELGEELGTTRAELSHEHDSWLRYDYPDSHATKRAKQFRGQEHKWFLLCFTGQDQDINLHTPHPEFSDWQWLPPEEVIKRVAPFKRQVYQTVLTDFAAPIHSIINHR